MAVGCNGSKLGHIPMTGSIGLNVTVLILKKLGLMIDPIRMYCLCD